jgi:endonuclease/exonuclease/phosphatase family metal-dependent hydrolase
VAILQVATFNVHHCEGRDGRPDIARTADAIRATGAGLVALQELDQNMERSGRVDQPALLAELTGLEVHFRPTLERDGGTYGLAIACSGPASVVTEPLPRHGDEEPRIALVAEWNGIGVIATHLSRQPKARELQTEALASLGAALKVPTAIVGDLNQGRRALGPLLEAGFRPPPSVHRTLVARFRRLEADHILTGPGLRHRRVWSVATAASDHLPLAAELEVL